MVPIVVFAATTNGTSGSDTLEGTDNRDTIYGKARDDKIYGYKGDDILYGGAGADEFRCNGAFDSVEDFDESEGDTIIGQCESINGQEFSGRLIANPCRFRLAKSTRTSKRMTETLIRHNRAHNLIGRHCHRMRIR